MSSNLIARSNFSTERKSYNCAWSAYFPGWVFSSAATSDKVPTKETCRSVPGLGEHHVATPSVHAQFPHDGLSIPTDSSPSGYLTIKRTMNIAPPSTPLVLNPSSRLRRSPLFDRLRAEGAKAWSVYNRTLIGQWYRSMEEDYAHLKSAVQVWDVGGERIVEVAGPDAARLIQMTTPRNIYRLADDQCAYLPVVDRHGGLLNDPVLTRLASDRYWLALADGDLGLYLNGLGAGAGLDVAISEPDVWILAIQGPEANTLVERVFGSEPLALQFFRHCRVVFEGRPMVIARTGWSGQGGFELHVEGSRHLVPIWETLMTHGRDLDVRAGCPNLIERIEAGLLSYGNDMGPQHTPFEAGLERFCHLDEEIGCLARDALMAKRRPDRQIRPVEIDGSPVPAVAAPWVLTGPQGVHVGRVTSAAWSPTHKTNVAIAMVDRKHWDAGTGLIVHLPDERRNAIVGKKFWGRK